jgi:hypothetical protein
MDLEGSDIDLIQALLDNLSGRTEKSLTPHPG